MTILSHVSHPATLGLLALSANEVHVLPRWPAWIHPITFRRLLLVDKHPAWILDFSAKGTLVQWNLTCLVDSPGSLVMINCMSVTPTQILAAVGICSKVPGHGTTA